VTSYLGYDPDRLPLLWDAMSAAESELSNIRCTDPDARAGILKVSGVATLLRARWMPFVRSLIHCSTLTGYQPATIGGGDLVNSYLAFLIAGNGWRTSTDPLAPAPMPITVDHARALAVWLNDHGDELDDTELAALQLMLGEILATPAVANAFTTSLSADGLSTLVGELGQRAIDIELHVVGGGFADGEEDVLATVDALFATLGGIIALSRDSHDIHAGAAAGELIEALPAMDPYGAANLIVSLDLDANTLARIATTLISIEHDEQLDEAAYTNGIRAIDTLLGAVIDTPGGASRLLVAMAQEPQALFNASDPTLTNTILLTGTTPDALLSAKDQALVLPALLLAIRHSLDDPIAPYNDRNPEIVSVAAEIAAPYLIELFLKSPAAFAYPSSDQTDIRRFFIRTPEILATLMSSRDLLATRFDHPLTGNLKADEKTLFELAQLTGVLDRLYSDAKIKPAIINQAIWGLGWTVVGTLGRLATPAPYKVAVGPTTAGTKYLLEWLGLGPDDVNELQAAVSANISDRSTLIAALVVDTTFASLVAKGAISQRTIPPPPPDLDADDLAQSYVVALQAWATATGLDTEVVRQVLLASRTLINPNTAAFDSMSDDEQD